MLELLGWQLGLNINEYAISFLKTHVVDSFFKSVKHLCLSDWFMQHSPFVIRFQGCPSDSLATLADLLTSENLLVSGPLWLSLTPAPPFTSPACTVFLVGRNLLANGVIDQPHQQNKTFYAAVSIAITPNGQSSC